jgi:hypothetical protein
MAKVRVLRLMEYVYDDEETAIRDKGNWFVQSEQHRGGTHIRSATLPMEVLRPEEVPEWVDSNNKAAPPSLRPL